MRFPAVLATMTAVWAGACLAVAPETWDHTTEAEFSEGEFASTGVSSLGEVTLARRIEILMPAETAGDVISSVAIVGKTIYAGSGVQPVVYRIAGGQPATAASMPATAASMPATKAEKLPDLGGVMVTALAGADGVLYAATGGDGGGLYRLGADGKFTKVWSDDQVKYIWAIASAGKGKCFLATGPKGKVFALDAASDNPKAEVIYDAGDLAKNILSLAVSQGNGLLYAGTDDNGLVIRIDPASKTSRVLLDAEENEISALALDSVGGVYAATSEAAKARGEAAGKPNSVKAGKTGTTLPSTRPASQPGVKGELVGLPAKDSASDDAEGSFAQVELGEMIDMITGQAASAPPGAAPTAPGPDVAPGPLGGAEPRQAGAGQTKSAADRPAAKPAEDEEGPAPGQADEGPPEPEPTKELQGPAAFAPPMAPPKPKRPAPAGKGNSVYYIRPDGLAETRFHRPLAILDMAVRDGTLYLATGNEGVVYSVSSDGNTVSMLADTDAAQVTAIAFDEAGRLVFATANKGSVAAMSADLAREGNFTSKVLDAGQIAKWGTVRVWGKMPAGAYVAVATRSGNVAEASDRTWSEWSYDQPVGVGFLDIVSPPGRFLQYRLHLTGDGQSSPVATHVRLIYQVGNLPPQITAVSVTPKDKGDKGVTAGGAQAFREVVISAGDPNGDDLVYEISLRELGGIKWVPIAKELDKNKHIWDTRTVADGDYELRVTASDKPANPPGLAMSAVRVSEVVLVDNTPPVIRKLSAAGGARRATVEGACLDASSRIAEVRYALDSQDDWVAVGAADGIFDSPSESFRFELTDIEPGPHRLAVKAADQFGNVAYRSVTFEAGK